MFRRDETLGKTMTLAGPKAWTVDEVITLCEKYADAEADVSLLNAPRPRPDLQSSLCFSCGVNAQTAPLLMTAQLLSAVQLSTSGSDVCSLCMGYAITTYTCSSEFVQRMNTCCRICLYPAHIQPLRNCTATCGLDCAGYASACLASEVHKEHTEKLPVGKGSCRPFGGAAD